MALKRNVDGQLSLYDALLYFMILLVATTSLFFYTLEMERSHGFLKSEDMANICEEARHSIMRSTIPETSYTDINGNTILRKNSSVESLIMEKFSLIDDGVERTNISYIQDIYAELNEFFRDEYHWGLIAKYGGESISISNVGEYPMDSLEDMGVSIYTSSWSKEMIRGKEGVVKFDFLISSIW